MKPKLNTFEVQEGKLGKPFRLTCTHKGKESKWLSGVEKYDWYYIFKYIDNGTNFALYEDVYGKIVKKLNYKEVDELLCS